MKVLTWKARTSKKVTLIELSKRTGISKSTLNNIDNGKVSPNMNQLEAIAKALECRISDLFESPYK